MTGWQTALVGIALGVASTTVASAQSAPADAGEAGECIASPQPHDQCPERCSTYDTCYIEEEQQLYYRVAGERFPCDSLDCEAAGAALADYCCQRGEYAPSRGGGGGGCALAGSGSRAAASGGELGGVWLAALALALCGRRGRASLR